MLEQDKEVADRLDAFLMRKDRLIRLAYRYLGSVGDAEDMVQEAWLRFSKVDVVKDAGGLLATIVSRLCLDRLKSAQRQRESYTGPWLPEPVIDETVAVEPDAAFDISYAVMRTLERLSPAERAAFFMHDLWDISFDEIAVTLGRSPEACRKLASRARSNLLQERQRFRPSAADLDRLLSTFQQASATGDATLLKALFAADAEYIADGGGKVVTALNVIKGNDAIARLMVSLARKREKTAEVRMKRAMINGQLGLLVFLDGKLDHTMSVDLDEAGLFRTVYLVRNPEKLSHLSVSAAAVFQQS